MDRGYIFYYMALKSIDPFTNMLSPFSMPPNISWPFLLLTILFCCWRSQKLLRVSENYDFSPIQMCRPWMWKEHIIFMKCAGWRGWWSYSDAIMTLWCHLGRAAQCHFGNSHTFSDSVCKLCTVCSMLIYTVQSVRLSTRVYSLTFYVNCLESDIMRKDPAPDDVVDFDKGGLENKFES